MRRSSHASRALFFTLLPRLRRARRVSAPLWGASRSAAAAPTARPIPRPVRKVTVGRREGAGGVLGLAAGEADRPVALEGTRGVPVPGAYAMVIPFLVVVRYLRDRVPIHRSSAQPT